MHGAFAGKRVAAMAEAVMRRQLTGHPAGRTLESERAKRLRLRAGQVGGAKVAVFGERLAERGDQRSFGDQVRRSGELLFHAVGGADFVGEHLEAGELLIGLLYLFLQVVVAFAKQFGFMLQGIVVGDLEGHAGVAAHHAEHEQRAAPPRIRARSRQTCAKCGPVAGARERMRQNKDEIVLLQSQPASIISRVGRTSRLGAVTHAPASAIPKRDRTGLTDETGRLTSIKLASQPFSLLPSRRAKKIPGRHFARNLIERRTLIFQLVKRDFQQRYVGSAAGWLWGLIHPLVLLGIYTFVFSYCMGMTLREGRWVTQSYPLFLFSGCCRGCCSARRCRGLRGRWWSRRI